MGGYPQLLAVKLVQIGQKRIFWFNIALSEVPKCNIRPSKKRQKYSFYAKTSNDDVFQFIDSNNFCINTFWIGPIPWDLYISGQQTLKADPRTP